MYVRESVREGARTREMYRGEVELNTDGPSSSHSASKSTERGGERKSKHRGESDAKKKLQYLSRAKTKALSTHCETKDQREIR